MADFLFYIFAGLTLLCGFLVVANPFTRSPVTSAMFLVLTLVSLAALFVLLEAFFIAAIQILVYAGAVMVLFLFVIMLMNLKDDARRKYSRLALAVASFAAAALMGVTVLAILRSSVSTNAAPVLQGSTVSLGMLLFTDFLLPFEVVSLILLVAMVGVILLSKRDLK